MSAAITVQYHKSLQLTTLYGYSLRVVVTNSVDMPTEIFIYQRGAAPAPAAGETVRDTFVAIADPLDLQEIPVDAPDLTEEIPYYRTSEVTLSFRSIIELNETMALIKADIELLVRSLQAMDEFELSEEETYD